MQRLRKRWRRTGLLVPGLTVAVLTFLVVSAVIDPSVTEVLGLSSLTGLPNHLSNELALLKDRGSLPNSSALDQVVLGTIGALTGRGGVENLGLLVGDVQTAQQDLDPMNLVPTVTIPGLSNHEAATLLPGAGLTNPNDLEGLTLNSKDAAPSTSTEPMNLAAVGTLPRATATETEGDCIFVAIDQSVPVLQSCGGTGGSGSLTSVNVGMHPSAIAYDSADNDLYVANSEAGTVSIVNGLAVVGTVKVGADPVAVAYDSSDNDVYVANAGQDTVSVISGASGQVIATIGVGVNPQDIAYVSSVKEVYVSNNGDGTVSVIGSTNAVVTTLDVGLFPAGMAFNPIDGDLYVAQQAADNVTLVNPTTNAVIGSIRVGDFPTALAYDPWNSDIYVANYLDGTVSVISYENQLVTTIPVGNLPDSVTVNQATGTMYVGCSADNTVWLISPQTNQPLFVVPVGHFPQGMAYDVATAGMYVTDYSDNNVEIVFGP